MTEVLSRTMSKRMRLSWFAASPSLPCSGSGSLLIWLPSRHRGAELVGDSTATSVEPARRLLAGGSLYVVPTSPYDTPFLYAPLAALLALPLAPLSGRGGSRRDRRPRSSRSRCPLRAVADAGLGRALEPRHGDGGRSSPLTARTCTTSSSGTPTCSWSRRWLPARLRRAPDAATGSCWALGGRRRQAVDRCLCCFGSQCGAVPTFGRVDRDARGLHASDRRAARDDRVPKTG